MARTKAQVRSSSSLKFQTIRRSLLLGCLLAVWMLAVVLRLYDLQIIQYVSLLNRAERQRERTVQIAPQRGTIYDRGMHPLAMSLAVDSIYAVPTQIADRDMVAKLLAPILDMDGQDLAGRLKAYRSFCWIKRKVTSKESARVRALNLKGIYFEKETKRFYPNGDLAAHALGYVGMDDNGLGGIEYGMNSEIRGQPGRMLVASDARRQSFRSTEWQGQPGKNVVLTLDENIQYIAENALEAAVKKYKAAGGTVIVQNPYTGEILALANEPTFNPNTYYQSPPQAKIDRAVSWIYEPGSTFKLVTLSAAIEERLINPNEVINCQEGSIVLAGHVIHDHERFGDLTVAEVLMHSSDVGAIKIGLRLGEDRFYHYIRRFGFGEKTDAGLPGEDRGLLRSPRRWSGISIGEISMGQEIGVTPLQMATAYSAIANGGILFQPRIVREVFRGDDHAMIPASSGHRIVDEATAEEMKQMLAGVVEHGTGVPAQLNGYTAAGKTGTAQKIDASGRYSHTHYVASFIGFAPAEKPAVTILVVIDSPVGAIYGAEVAAPAFRSIAEQTLNYLNVPQDDPSRWLQSDSRNPAGPPRQKRGNLAGNPPLEPDRSGTATRPVQLVSYSKPSDPPHGGTVVLDEGPLLTVPDFSGLAARRVTEECEKLGLDMEMVGTGLAAEQNPSPGSQVRRGATIWVRFAR